MKHWVSVALCLGLVVLCCQLEPVAAGGDIICSLAFKQSLQGLYIEKTVHATARSDLQLCYMCTDIVSQGLVFAHDNTTGANDWKENTRANVCRSRAGLMGGDCVKLSERILKNQETFFTAAQANDKDSYDLFLLDTMSKAIGFCQVGQCCEKPKSNKPIESTATKFMKVKGSTAGPSITHFANLTCRHLRASIDEDRRTIQKDTTLIHKVQVQLLNDKKVIEQKVKETMEWQNRLTSREEYIVAKKDSVMDEDAVRWRLYEYAKKNGKDYPKPKPKPKLTANNSTTKGTPKESAKPAQTAEPKFLSERDDANQEQYAYVYQWVPDF